jgi:predicted metal-dependent hydrolase
VTTEYTLTVADIPVEVRHKEIKNLHVGVYPPDGRVRVSAPTRLGAEAVRLALVTRIPWIRRRRAEFFAQERQTAREYVSGESHYFLGKRYRLEVGEEARRQPTAPGAIPPGGSAEVTISGETILLSVPPERSREHRERIMTDWYRARLGALIPDLVERWEPVVGHRADEVRIRKMKTKWGSCNIDARRIWLNLELAKKPPRCIEYILVHELIHLAERHHNDRFRALMDRHLPDWRTRRDELNAAPLAHEEWGY